MKSKIKMIGIGLILILITMSASTINPNKAQATIPDDVCSMYVPILEDCTWYPVNCLCPIIIKDNK